MKSLAFLHRNDQRFAVGDFSPVLSVFSYHELGNTVSPFLLLDHIGPGRLRPSGRPGGVDDHPHRGFETVTLVFAGELQHRDSTGGGGVIRAGDVQWMTAGRGVIHQEKFSPAFAREGGPFEMVQLWVNLPAADKMGPPRYQALAADAIPVVDVDGGRARVIAGRLGTVEGPARTHTRILVLDVAMRAGASAVFPAAEGDTALVYLRSGRLRVGDGGGGDTGADRRDAEEVVDDQGLAVMSSHGGDIAVTTLEDSRFLVLAGEPISEPINGHGPFVMNSYDEILQAYDDIRSGHFASPPRRAPDSGD